MNLTGRVFQVSFNTIHMTSRNNNKKSLAFEFYTTAVIITPNGFTNNLTKSILINYKLEKGHFMEKMCDCCLH